ncbi:ecdysteroid UDP-glucosyltransferase [Elysia marginata]|uniref:Ecdysteroid UDP-glucosyltransferase n=1 Tax=Elysia marginata TaxID=1093978 RepID=A0AAV4K259_9GAST|nr:ecdysteroid UDP-glucosyltransferase [Elysia marginata]
MLGMGEGGRRRGRPCMRWKDDIKTVTGLTLSELVRAVENRDHWRQLITTITRSRPRLDGTRLRLWYLVCFGPTYSQNERKQKSRNPIIGSLKLFNL